MSLKLHKYEIAWPGNKVIFMGQASTILSVQFQGPNALCVWVLEEIQPTEKVIKFIFTTFFTGQLVPESLQDLYIGTAQNLQGIVTHTFCVTEDI